MYVFACVYVCTCVCSCICERPNHGVLYPLLAWADLCVWYPYQKKMSNNLVSGPEKIIIGHHKKTLKTIIQRFGPAQESEASKGVPPRPVPCLPCLFSPKKKIYK